MTYLDTQEISGNLNRRSNHMRCIQVTFLEFFKKSGKNVSVIQFDHSIRGVKLLDVIVVGFMVLREMLRILRGNQSLICQTVLSVTLLMFHKQKCVH